MTEREVKMRLALGFAGVCLTFALPAAALEIGADWRIVHPDMESSGVVRNLAVTAKALADAIGEASGLTIPVSGKTAAHPASHTIWIGAEFAEKKGVLSSDFGTMDDGIVVKDGDVYLFGHDACGRKDHEWNPWYRCALPSGRAVTRFMQKFLDVAFVMPGVLGRDVPKRERIIIPDDYSDRHLPAFPFGAGECCDVVYSLGNGIMGMGTFHTYGGHTYPEACPQDKYFKSHPEYFGLRGGVRARAPENGQQPLCISNPEVEQLIVDELVRRFDAGASVCQLAQQDAALVCECGECEALYGTGRDWNEKLWIFHRKIAERIEKLRPGKIVQILCYGLTRKPPKTFSEFPSNVMIEMCSTSDADFAEWKRYRVPQGFTVYLYLWGDYPLPGFTAKHSVDFLAARVRQLKANNVRGIFRCGYAELAGMEGPGYWVFNNCLENPSADPTALVSEYCRRAYGAAASFMYLFHMTLDDRLRMLDAINYDSKAKPANSLPLMRWIYGPETVKAMEGCLARAETTDGLTEKQKRRIGLVRTEFDYAKNLGRISLLHAAYQLSPSRESFRPLAEAILERNAWIDGLYDVHGRFKPVEGWPELRFFGYSPKNIMMSNGRLSATLGAPLTWNVRHMLENGILPGVGIPVAPVVRVPSGSSVDIGSEDMWKSTGWNALGGVQQQKIPFAARFKAVYDDENLYLLFESDLADDVEVKPTGRDVVTLCLQENYDMMIDPSGTRDGYYHLIWTPLRDDCYDAHFGAVTDPLDPNYNKEFAPWNGNWRIDNRRDRGKWRSVVTIPFGRMGVAAPKPGERYCFNVGRYWVNRNDPNDPVLGLWAPNHVTTGFVNANAMGELLFK